MENKGCMQELFLLTKICLNTDVNAPFPSSFDAMTESMLDILPEQGQTGVSLNNGKTYLR